MAAVNLVRSGWLGGIDGCFITFGFIVGWFWSRVVWFVSVGVVVARSVVGVAWRVVRAVFARGWVV